MFRNLLLSMNKLLKKIDQVYKCPLIQVKTNTENLHGAVLIITLFKKKGKKERYKTIVLFCRSPVRVCTTLKLEDLMVFY